LTVTGRIELVEEGVYEMIQKLDIWYLGLGTKKVEQGTLLAAPADDHHSHNARKDALPQVVEIASAAFSRTG